MLSQAIRASVWAFLMVAAVLIGLHSNLPLVLKAACFIGACATASITRERRDSLEGMTDGAPVVIDKTAPHRALIIGAGSIGQTLAESLENDGGYRVVGFLDETSMLEAGRWPILGDRDQAVDIVRRMDIDHVFIAHAPSWQQALAEDLADSNPRIALSVVPTAYEAMLQTAAVRSRRDIALLQLGTDVHPISDGICRALDICIAVVMGICALPILTVAWVLVKATSRGSFIFAQERSGRSGKIFTLYKVRTMVPDAEADTGPVLSSGQADPRLTAIGRWLRKFRIDEIPQLWNVIRGDMSMVGPRPERPEFVREYELEIPGYARRHDVRPGITGLAQVCGGYHTHVRDKLRFDLLYISHRSAWMDICILVRTVLVVLFPGK